jgi:hypothetical protein
MLNFLKIILFLKKIKNLIEFGNISFVEMDSSKLINYLTNVCWTDQGITIIDLTIRGTRVKLQIAQISF